MQEITHHHIMIFFFSLALLIGLARILGEFCKKIGQPSILGEIAAGILLGPTVFSYIAPDLQATLFPSSGPLYVTFEFIGMLAITLFMLIAGMEVDLKCLKRQAKPATVVGISSMVLPFAGGFALVYLFPKTFDTQEKTFVTALFMATALAISALPVITKILMDLKLIKTDLGVTIVAAAIFNDLTGWMIFAIVLSLMSDTSGGFPWETIVGIVVAGIFMLTIGRKIVLALIPRVQAHASWPGGMMGFVLTGALLAAGVAEWIGVHGIFGSFLFGVALGDSPHLRYQTEEYMEKFISFILTPIFFATIGLKVNFLTHFDLFAVVILLIVGSITKILGSYMGAKFCGMSRRESWALGWGMNARGVMEIILAIIALEAGVINDTVFVAVVILALFTSMTSGALMKISLKRRSKASVATSFSRGVFVSDLKHPAPAHVIKDMVLQLNLKHESQADIIQSTISREQLMSTGLENGLAVPHCRTDLVKKPILLIGIHENGADFDCFDHGKAHVIALIITPLNDPESQLELISILASHFSSKEEMAKAMQCKSKVDMQAILNAADEMADKHT
ncbi:cation:proton antiporter [Lentisphaera marina]|uniref:cation:proton antiporter domain-containing protein n=1 Tax=Lentisphaera marina TaxID=1111041 RepID=UPI002365DAE1|nr:cation:proton antiporter [Lentisphaera marina]MDD7984049.1 cation:proton antiporter [Lentisphaera marina]